MDLNKQETKLRTLWNNHRLAVISGAAIVAFILGLLIKVCS